ncbi:MAG: hypothetical protein AMXMBFR81_15690 [Chthonomonas sp.]
MGQLEEIPTVAGYEKTPFFACACQNHPIASATESEVDNTCYIKQGRLSPDLHRRGRKCNDQILRTGIFI